MIPGAVHRSPGVCLTAEEIAARRPSDEGSVLPAIVSNGVLFLQTRSVGSHSTSGGDGMKEGKGWEGVVLSLY